MNDHSNELRVKLLGWRLPDSRYQTLRGREGGG